MNDNSTPRSINSSPTLIDFLEVFRGAEISTKRAQDINEGKLGILIGFVATQNYGKNQGNLGNLEKDYQDCLTDVEEDAKKLTQVTIRTEIGELITISNNSNFALNPKVLELNNADLLNKPKVIYIKNIQVFRDNFQDAARYGQRVACVYDKEDNCLILVSLESNQDYSLRNNDITSAAHWPRNTGGG